MGLKELLGDDYREDMTLEEVDKLLEGRKFVDPETLPKSVSKEVFDKTASELAQYKRELKKLREQNLTAEEKLKLELENAKKVQSEYIKELHKLRAKEIFIAGGLEEEEYTPILDMVVSEDEETTIGKATQVMELIKTRNELTEKKVKMELLKDTPKPPAGDAGNPNTLDKAIEDARKRGDQVQLASLIRQQQEQLNNK